MLTCNIKGGLGNQLFQIFFLLSTALEYNTPWYIVPAEKIGNRSSYWSTVFRNCVPWFQSAYRAPISRVREEDLPRIPTNILSDMFKNTNTILDGYFQDYRYFDKHFSSICSLLGISTIKTHVEETHKYPYNKTTSLHFRYGDYKNLAEHFNILEYSYYHSALLRVIQNELPISITTTVLVFYEPEDHVMVSEIVDRLKADRVFARITFVYIDTNISDWEQLFIMSNCKHNIIANSTFSWWGAYFNVNPKKIVCYPSVWYRHKHSHINTDGLHPPTWHCIRSNN